LTGAAQIALSVRGSSWTRPVTRPRGPRPPSLNHLVGRGRKALRWRKQAAAAVKLVCWSPGNPNGWTFQQLGIANPEPGPLAKPVLF